MTSGDDAQQDFSVLARRHGFELLVQFGSTVTGRTHSRSDLDLGVLFRSGSPSFRQLAELTHDLQKHLPEREVDVAVLNHADPLFLRKVTEACRLLHGSEKDFRRFRLYAFRRYRDHRRFLELERKYIEGALGRLSGS